MHGFLDTALPERTTLTSKAISSERIRLKLLNVEEKKESYDMLLYLQQYKGTL